MGISIAAFMVDGRISEPFKTYADFVLLGLFSVGAAFVAIGMAFPGEPSNK